MAVDPYFMCFAISHETKFFYFAARDVTRAGALREGRERLQELGVVVGENGCEAFEFTVATSVLIDKMKCWLAVNGIIGAKANEAIRAIGRDMMQILKKGDVR